MEHEKLEKKAKNTNIFVNLQNEWNAKNNARDLPKKFLNIKRVCALQTRFWNTPTFYWATDDDKDTLIP